MDDVGIGRLFRLARIRARLRQRDLAARARVSQTVVSKIERGRCEEVTLPKLRSLGMVLGIRVELNAHLPAGEASRLLDVDHARMIEAVANDLRAAEWRVVPEYTFNHFGDRGSIDLLGWHAATRTLLLVEVKTRLLDIQALLASEDRKRRLVSMLVRRDFGWEAATLGQLLVVERTTANRRAIAEHEATLAAVYPDDARSARSWLRHPAGHMRCIWLRSFSPTGTPTQLRKRVRSTTRA